MTETKNSTSDRLRQILVAAATAGVIIFNWLATAGYVGGVTPEVVSDRYPTHITPAGYAFSIWGLIYTALIAFAIYQFLPRNAERFRPIRTLYILTCALNCAWIYFWHHEYIILCAGIIFLLGAVLFFINSKLRNTLTSGDYWFVKFPFGIYFGWITAATLANTMIALVYQKSPLADSMIFNAGFIFLAGILGVLMRIKLNNYFYPLAVAWALTAIAVKQSGKTIIVATCAVAVIACLIAAASFVMNMPSSADKSDN